MFLKSNPSIADNLRAALREKLFSKEIKVNSGESASDQKGHEEQVL